jgi:hypothetical protein
MPSTKKIVDGKAIEGLERSGKAEESKKKLNRIKKWTVAEER